MHGWTRGQHEMTYQRWPSTERVAAKTRLMLTGKQGHDPSDLLTFSFCHPLCSFTLPHLLSLFLLLYWLLHNRQTKQKTKYMAGRSIGVNEVKRNGHDQIERVIYQGLQISLTPPIRPICPNIGSRGATNQNCTRHLFLLCLTSRMHVTFVSTVHPQGNFKIGSLPLLPMALIYKWQR